MLHVPVSVCGEVYVGVRKGDTDAENFRNREKNSHLMLLLGKRTRAYGRRKTYFTEFDTAHMRSIKNTINKDTSFSVLGKKLQYA